MGIVGHWRARSVVAAEPYSETEMTHFPPVVRFNNIELAVNPTYSFLLPIESTQQAV